MMAAPAHRTTKVFILRLLFTFHVSLFTSILPCLPSIAVDRVIAGEGNQPFEISLPPSSALSEWVVREYPLGILEIVTVRRLPAETIFLFRPKIKGTGIVKFANKAIGTDAVTEWHEVEVIITDRKIQDPAGVGDAGTGGRGAADPARKTAAAGQPPSGGESGLDVDDPLVLAMIAGRLGFPAKNPDLHGDTDSASILRRKYPLPYSTTYIFPPGSYLLNPMHRMPLPDTPPGIDTPPAAYHQALQLARRGLIGPSLTVLEGIAKDQKAKKNRNPVVEAYYEFMKGHLHLADGRYDDAIKTFEGLFADREFGVGGRFYAALAKEYAGDTIGAISGYQGVISRNPEGYFTPEAAWRIARLFYNARAFSRSIQEYTDFIMAYSRSPFIDDVLMDLARVYDQVYAYQNFDIALKLYDAVATEYPESPYLDTALARKKFILENYF